LVCALVACHHAGPTIPEGAVRERWIAERRPPRAAPDGAEEPPARGCPASERELVEAAGDASAEVIAKLAASRAERLAAEVPDARPLGLRLTNVRLEQGFADRAEAGLRFRPARPGTIDAERDVIRREADALAAEARDEARLARAEVRALLAEAREASALAALAADEVVAAEGEVTSLGQAASAGATREIDRARAELDLAEVIAERARREAERDAALAEAKALAGVDARCAVPLAPSPERPLARAHDAVEAEALGRHPLVDARWASEQGALAARHLAVAEAWPWLDFIQVGVERRADPIGDETHVVVGLELELPIFLWGGEATDAADARIEAEGAVTRATTAAVTREIEAARVALDAALAREAAVPGGPSDERLDALFAAARSGNADRREVARVARDRRRLERTRVEARRAIEDATIRLDAALGR